MKEGKVVRYLMVSNIAKQHWCHQFFMSRAIENEGRVKEAVKELKGYPGNKIRIDQQDREYKYLPEDKLRELAGLSKGERVPGGLVEIVKNKVYLPTPSNALEVGIREEGLFAERYPTVRAFFTWKGYTVVACPDGISDDFCYEFKSIANPWFYSYVKPIILTQVHIYSYFYRRAKVRAEIRIRSTEESKIIEEPRDRTRAVKALRTMDRLLRRKIKPIPPVVWKCRKCDYKNRYPIRKQGKFT